jgi:hypothetical protein
MAQSHASPSIRPMRVFTDKSSKTRRMAPLRLDSPVAGGRHIGRCSARPDSLHGPDRPMAAYGVDWPQAAFKAPSLRISPDKSSYNGMLPA